MASFTRGFAEVFKRGNPCPICDSVNGKCKKLDRGAIICRRTEPGTCNGYSFLKLCSLPAFAIWTPDDEASRFSWECRKRQEAACRPHTDFPETRNSAKLQADIEARQHDQAAKFAHWKRTTGRGLEPIGYNLSHLNTLQAWFPHFSRESLCDLPIIHLPSETLCSYTEGHYSKAYGFPECNGAGEVIGYNFRWKSGRKESAGARGITIPDRLRKTANPDLPMPETHEERCVISERLAWNIYVVEGASDVMAMAEMGLLAIGRPSNTGGVTEIAEWVKKHLPKWRWNLIVVGENDQKPDGKWPGLDGARRVAQQLANELGHIVEWTLPPKEAKDVRDWFEMQMVNRKPQPSPIDLGRELDFELVKASDGFFPGTPLPPSPGTPGTVTTADGVTEEDQSRLPTEADMDAWGAMLQEVMVKARCERQQEAARLETLTAETIAAARSSHSCDSGMRCCRPRPIVLHNLVTNGPRVQYVRCENYTACKGCREWRIYRETANATLRLHSHAGRLYELTCPADQWATMRRRINRMGGEYMRVNYDCQGDNYYVVTTVAVTNAIIVLAGIAVSTIKAELDAYDEQDRPVATSHGWKLPVAEEKVDRYRRVGMGSRWLARRTLMEIANACEASLKLHRSTDSRTRCDAAYDFDRGTWDDATRDYAFACIMQAEVIPRDLWDAITNPCRTPPPLPEDDLPW